MTDEGAVPSRDLEELLLHMAWADELVWREVISLPDAAEDGRIRELGGEPPLTDFIAWVWAGRPDPKHPPPPSA